MDIEEKKYLETYDINKYDRPSVTTDIALFTMRTSEEDSYRHEPENHLSILLIKRGEHPFKGKWALPGGFIQRGESIEECAFREISQETGAAPTALMPVEVFSNPDRDPRGWVISHAFLSVSSEGAVSVKGGDDAADARWFDVELSYEGDIVVLTLVNDDIRLSASLKKQLSMFKKQHYEVLDNGELSFDHAAIILSSLDSLKLCARDFELIFDFLPEKFTLTELQRVQETVLCETVVAANFRRKVASYVTETDEYTSGAGHRPAKLFKRNFKEE